MYTISVTIPLPFAHLKIDLYVLGFFIDVVKQINLPCIYKFILLQLYLLCYS